MEDFTSVAIQPTPSEETYYLAVQLNFGEEEELDTILSELRTTVSDARHQMVGYFDVVGPLSANEVMEEAFCLGGCYAELEKIGLLWPIQSLVLPKGLQLEEAVIEALFTSYIDVKMAAYDAALAAELA